jgi:hypothetical protein
MAGPFDSAWLKWGWAVIEAKALEADIDAFSKVEGKDFGFPRCEYQPKHSWFAVSLESTKGELQESGPLIR